MDSPPTKPDIADCCNSGCNPCILDVYEEQIKKYKNRLKNFKDVPQQNCISLTSYSTFVLKKVEVVSHSVRFFTFKYLKIHNSSISPKINQRLFFNPGQYFLLKATHENDSFTRAYTPLNLNEEDSSSFTILVKLLPNGKMSNYLSNLKIGEESLWRGPYGEFQINYNFKHILFIAQGTGIAPIFNIISNILNNEECYTFLKLFYCCSDNENILLRNHLYNFLSYWNFSYEVFLKDATNVAEKFNETIHKQKLCEQYIRSFFNNVEINSLFVVICGSDKFSTTIKENIVKCNINKDKIFIF